MASTSLLLHGNGTNGSTTVIDEAIHVITVAGAAQISTTQSKFGGASIKINATTDYLSTPGGAHFDVLATESYTLEMFLYRTTDSAYGEVCNFGDSHIRIYVDNSGRLNVKQKNVARYSGPAAADTENRAAITINTWHHIAIVQDAVHNYFSIFVNGHCVFRSAAYLQSMVSAATAYVAGALAPIGALSGYVDEVRFVKDEATYYYSGPSIPAYSAYTVPIAEYPAPSKIALPSGFLTTKVGTPFRYADTIASGFLAIKVGAPLAGYRRYFDAASAGVVAQLGAPTATQLFTERTITARMHGFKTANVGIPDCQLSHVVASAGVVTKFGIPSTKTTQQSASAAGFMAVKIGSPTASLSSRFIAYGFKAGQYGTPYAEPSQFAVMTGFRATHIGTPSGPAREHYVGDSLSITTKNSSITVNRSA